MSLTLSVLLYAMLVASFDLRQDLSLPHDQGVQACGHA